MAYFTYTHLGNKDMYFRSSRMKFRFLAEGEDSLNYISHVQMHSQPLHTFGHYENNGISDNVYMFDKSKYTKLSDAYRYRRLYNRVKELHHILRFGKFYRVIFVKKNYEIECKLPAPIRKVK